MKFCTGFAITLCILLWPDAPRARDIPLDDLGALSLEYAVATPVAELPGAAVWAEVTHRPGAALGIHAPRRIQQVNFLVESGQWVEKGQPVAELSGPEIHHWQLEYEALKARYRLADERYRRNQPLRENRSISEDQWYEVLTRWQELRLEFEHMQHFAELVKPRGGSPHDSLTLNAPFDAWAIYPLSGEAPAEDELIASFLPAGQLRLRARVAIADRENLAALSVPGCRVSISSVSERVSGFLVDAWSEALGSDCGLLLGQTVSARPLYRGGSPGTQLLRVPPGALLDWQQQHYLLQRQGTVLRLQPVNLLSRDEQGYLVRGAASLNGSEILVTSVSAVQGLLLGLGGE